MRKGLEAAMQLVGSHSATRGDRYSVIMMFTDGCPTDTDHGSDALGAFARTYMGEHKECSCPVETFGFGYGTSINSAMLNKLSYQSGGSYHYIPDSGFVGTVMVNSMANLMCTAMPWAVLCVKPAGGATFDRIRDEDGGEAAFHIIDLGSIRYGQTKDVVLHVKGAKAGQPYLKCSLEYKLVDGTHAFTRERVSPGFPELGSPADMDVAYHVLRTEVIGLIGGMLRMESSYRSFHIARAFLEQNVAVKGGDARAVALMQDINTQVHKAIESSDGFDRWGRHYLPSLCRAYETETCNNFKDPGVQVFGGDLFRAFRLEGSRLFDTLPAPTAAAKVSMSSLNDSSAGCIDGSCLVDVLSAGGKPAKKCVRDLTNTDIMADTGAHVVCLTKHYGAAKVYKVGEALLTQYHPVLTAGSSKWKYACDASDHPECAAAASDPCVYNLVLSPAVPVLIGNTACATLGMVAEVEYGNNHSGDFWGSQWVIDILQHDRGWSNGCVSVYGTARNPDTGVACSIMTSL